MSEATRQKGREFCAALLDEQRGYKTIEKDLRIVVALEALSRTNNVPQHAAQLLGVSGECLRSWMRTYGLKRTIVLEERVSA